MSLLGNANNSSFLGTSLIFELVFRENSTESKVHWAPEELGYYVNIYYNLKPLQFVHTNRSSAPMRALVSDDELYLLWDASIAGNPVERSFGGEPSVHSGVSLKQFKAFIDKYSNAPSNDNRSNSH